MNKQLGAAALCMALAGCGNPAYTNCVANGIAYFKEIGSYPTLQAWPEKGRKAKDVAKQRCIGHYDAFPQRSTP